MSTSSAPGRRLARPGPALRAGRPWVLVAAVLLSLLAGTLTLGAPAARAQGVAGPPQSLAFASRAVLTQALADARRRGARDEAARLQDRLTNGDVRVGDRLAVTLTIDSARTYDLIVRDSQRVEVQPLGRLQLRGVLRSELQPALLRFFQQYYRRPEVQVQQLVRVGVLGAVARPGYYAVPPDAFVTDLLTERAGGGLANGDPKKIELKRGGQKILDRKAYQRAAAAGLTLADVGVRSGDELQVGERRNRDKLQTFQTALFAVSTLISLVFLIRAVNN